ncbi:MAG: M23 family metallopeptidase, partial [Syntrophales bacterium]
RFGIQPDGTYRNGIVIESDIAVPVKASAAGKVIYSANMKDYGETVIIRHDDHYHTVYSHLGKRLVRMDEHIKKGQRIALAGAGNPVGKLRFEFEVRYHNKAKNPLFFLP